MTTLRPALTVARSLRDLEAVYPLWERFRILRVDADPEFFTTFVRLSPHVVRPHVAVLGDPTAPAGVLVARIEDVELTAAVGYKVVYRPAVRMLTVVHGGVADGGALLSQLVLGELRRALEAGEADVALIPAVRTDSELYTEARRLGWLARGHGHRAAIHRRLVLPDQFDEFFAGIRHRKKIEAYWRRLERAFGDRLSVQVYRSPSDVELVLRDLTEVSRKTYQHGLGVAFADDKVRQELTRLGLERGWFQAWVLYVDGSPISFWPGNTYSRVFYTGTPGYDPAFASYSVGTLLLLRVIEDLCRDPDVEAVDFDFGDSEYKQRFSNESWEEEDVLLFAPTFRSARLNLIRSGLMAGESAGKSFLRRLGVDRALKRRWRDHLSRGAAEADSR